MEEEQKESFINPIDGSKADESISESEAKKRGYLTLEFLLKHLEDENEYVKVLEVDSKKIVVHLRTPTAQYKKKLSLDHERLLNKEKVNNVVVPINNSCSLDSKNSSEDCIACGS